MKLKISTPAKVIFQGEIEKISIPTENGNLKVMDGHAPMVTSVKPGIIKLWPMENHIKVGNEMYVSTSKGMVFIDGKIVRIVSAEATVAPEESESTLLQNRKALEEKIKRLKTE
jgi:F-type H+-transporting ATPase subunit epsilon